MSKLISSLITIFAAIVVSFFLVRSMPGDFIHLRATEIQMQQSLTYEAAYKIAKSQYNYDPSVPMLQQFVSYMSGLLRGNLGKSIMLRIPVTQIIFKAMAWTMFLCSVALFLSFCIGSLIGLIIAYRRKNGLLEPIVSFLAVIAQSVPNFIIAIVLIIIFAIYLRWFPLRGAYSLETVPGFNIAFIAGIFYHAVLPVGAYLLSTIGGWALAMKASATSVMSEDYVSVAKAKGLKEKRILVNYIGKNAVMPLVPGLAITFSLMVSSSLFVENIFSYPGIGFFFGFAINNRDFILLQGILLISIVLIVVSNHIADFIHALLDPRIKF